MRKNVFFLPVLFFHLLSLAQAPKDFIIPVKINTNNLKPSITISWTANADARNYTIKRKLVTDDSYLSSFSAVGFVDNSVTVQTSFEDTTIEPGKLYEYEISGNFAVSLPADRNNYICAGIDVPAVHTRGSIVLLCDSSIVNDILNDLTVLYADLAGDGWKVIRIDVERSAGVAEVKNKIVDAYAGNPDLKQVLIIGHVPVPYSGDIYPDGHSNHNGSWPADGYYGSMTNSWTDTGTSYSIPITRPENINLPGDGKLDQSYLPAVQLAVGRIDLSNLPSFAITEAGLLSRYLKKNHQFRHNQIHVNKSALIDDNFPAFSEKFSQSAWKSFSSLVGYDNISVGQYETDLFNGDGYLWSYGCGSGIYTGASGIAATTDFATKNYKTVFTQLFGSYFGDWDSQNNLMRASLASGGHTLTCVWGGRPHWFFHHMSAGLPIGYAELLTMNNTGGYTNTGNESNMVHIGLMGDPTLRSNYITPAQNFSVVVNGTAIDLQWTSEQDDNDAFYIYRSNSVTGPFTLMNENPEVLNAFTDNSPLEGNNVYMLRRIKMDTIITAGEYNNNSTYANLSQGVFDSVNTIKVYRFTGNGNWDNTNNWLNNVIPPSILPYDSEIVISPVEGGICILNVPQIISPGAKITVENNQHFIIAGKLTMQ